MTNVSRNKGMVPLRNFGSMAYTPNLVECVVPASDGADIFVGDIVELAAAAGTNGQTAVALAAPSADIYGVVVRMSATNSSYDSVPYRAASTLRYVLVEVGVDVQYLIQEDGVGGTLTATNIGNTAEVVGPGAGSTANGFSTMELDSSTAAAGSAQQLIIDELYQSPDNEFGANAKYVVRINKKQLASGNNSLGV